MNQEEQLQAAEQSGIEQEQQDLSTAPEEKVEDSTPSEPSQQESEATSLGFDLKAYSEELLASEDTKLSEETMASIYDLASKSGIPKEAVDAYINDRQAEYLAFKEANAKEKPEVTSERIRSIVGGDEALDALQNWANTTLKQEELDYYVAQVEAGGKQADMAIKALMFEYSNQTGVGVLKEPSLLAGGSSTTVDRYSSSYEVQADIKSERYRKDPKFRDQVDQKIKRSKLY